MKWHTTLTLLVVALFVSVLGGCPSMGLAPLHSDSDIQEMSSATSPAEAAARVAVDEANANLSAAYRVIKSNSDGRLWKKATAKQYLAKVQEVERNYVDPAFRLLVSRDWSSAQVKAAAARELLILLQREMVAYAQPKEKGGGS